MKSIVWNPEKNEILKAERGVSFEGVVLHMQAGDLLDTFDHPNQERYAGQKIHAVAIEEYVYDAGASHDRHERAPHDSSPSNT